MIHIKRLHHIAVICSDYERSKRFYTAILGFQLDAEVYRDKRRSFKADLSLHGHYLIELFSFPDPPPRVTNPEASGLRHIAFEVEDVEETVKTLALQNIIAEAVRVDEFTGNKFTFIADPDGLPVEFYEK